ncbi:MAG: TIGR02452 family protein [Kofleriaceae bacterium]|nr:TIGR02452 family protein [Kofleriaceae bacterium]
MAADTIAACARGGYDGPAGRVDLRAAIDRAVAGTALHDPASVAAVVPARGAHATTLDVTDESTVAALRRHAGAPALACLNFASARNPGGGYRGGAQAQEESLARASALVPCLETRLADHYAPNRAARSLLYLDLAIWSPAVPFFRDDDGAWLPAPILASVITCAAPNAGALADRGDPDLARVPEVLARRADLVLRVAAHHGVQTLVLGAWGAGVFGNDPATVADTFAGLLEGPFRGAFATVTFAVLDHGPGAPTRAAFARRLAR